MASNKEWRYKYCIKLELIHLLTYLMQADERAMSCLDAVPQYVHVLRQRDDTQQLCVGLALVLFFIYLLTIH